MKGFTPSEMEIMKQEQFKAIMKVIDDFILEHVPFDNIEDVTREKLDELNISMGSFENPITNERKLWIEQNGKRISPILEL